jgi:hypothetical protein
MLPSNVFIRHIILQNQGRVIPYLRTSRALVPAAQEEEGGTKQLGFLNSKLSESAEVAYNSPHMQSGCMQMMYVFIAV